MSAWARPGTGRTLRRSGRVATKAMGRPRSGSGIVASFSVGLVFAASIGCVPLRGGWDVDRVLEEEGISDRGPERRIGDMLPFPVLEGDRVGLIACRFPRGRVVRVRGGGPGWEPDWGRAAVDAVARRIGSTAIRLELEDSVESVPIPEIEILATRGGDGSGPRGLGDTLGECDVSPLAGSPGRVRGRLVHAEIRMRRWGWDRAGRPVVSTAEEWVGALMHELGHALGFSGHVARGDSILVRDQGILRKIGRGALAGRAGRDVPLAALYRLPTGRRLGARRIREADRAWLTRFERWRTRSREAASSIDAIRASVGDREAAIVWTLADGRQFRVRFPAWQAELRARGSISALPDDALARLLEQEDD